MGYMHSFHSSPRSTVQQQRNKQRLPPHATPPPCRAKHTRYGRNTILTMLHMLSTAKAFTYEAPQEQNDCSRLQRRSQPSDTKLTYLLHFWSGHLKSAKPNPFSFSIVLIYPCQAEWQ